jgi:hypothetical protein
MPVTNVTALCECRFVRSQREDVFFSVSCALTLHLKCCSSYSECNNLVKRGATAHRLLS